jgi:hypothetical protein
MKISVKEWILFILVAVLCLGLWFKFTYPQFAFVNLSIDKSAALEKAQSYLNSRGVDTKKYLKAIVFEADEWADRYLQKAVGFQAEEEFMRRHNFELFYWNLRFFNQFQKEEYIVRVSPTSGSILGLWHLIEDIAPRPSVEKGVARLKAEMFLKDTFSVNLDEYDFHEEKIKRYENRIDYSFSWEKKNVYIPWKKGEGGAKLLIGLTVSGDEIREFHRNNLDVPEKFRRYIENQLVFGHYLSSFYFLVFIFLLISSISILIKRKQTVTARLCKKWFVSLAIVLAIMNLVYIFNNIQNIIIRYPTSASLPSFLGVYFVRTIINLILTSAAFIIPGIAGESLRGEVFPRKPHSSFAHYLKSTFYSRKMAKAILFGYVLFFIMVGLQAGIFYLGQRYLGVWKEWLQLSQFSSAYIPALSAFVIGLSASVNEEVMFRLYGISWAKRYLKNTVLAVVFIALLWGFGHCEYPIFPVWFRGIEVSILGILYGFIFVRYGFIPLIVAHYLFDVFWGTAAYILGRTTAYLFSGSIFILFLPLIFACLAFFINREDRERAIQTILDKIQRYNLTMLLTFVSAKKSAGLSASVVKKELIDHNWDYELVDLAIDEVYKGK